MIKNKLVLSIIKFFKDVCIIFFYIIMMTIVLLSPFLAFVFAGWKQVISALLMLIVISYIFYKYENTKGEVI